MRSTDIRFFNLGILRYAPLEVKLWPDGPAREPDIFFVSNDKLGQLTDKRFEGAAANIYIYLESTSERG